MKEQETTSPVWTGPSPIEILEHPDPVLRAAFVEGLGIDGHPGSLPLLIKALGDGELSVRMAAARALTEVAPWLMSDGEVMDLTPELMPA